MKEKVGKFTGRIHVGVVAVVVRGVYVGLYMCVCVREREDERMWVKEKVGKLTGLYGMLCVWERKREDER